MNRFRNHALALASLCLGLLGATPARAASLQKVDPSEWSAAGLPGYVNMYIYVPGNLASAPPIVVAPHHCQGTGPGTFNEMSSLVSVADRNGFIIIFPEATAENCWDAGSARSLKHDGGGDTQAIVQMVRYTLSKYHGDASRVYSVGGSSGGIMTEALLGVYPDVFMAGVSLMGVPCGCWAAGYNDVTGTGSSAQWAGQCAGGNVSKTGAQWGELVRSYFPSYTGHRPRLQHWHGTADTTLNFKNLAEDVKEWTNLLSLSESPTGNDTPSSGTTHQFWKNACGYTVYETFALAGIGHAVPFDGNAVAAYFGLDKAGGQDPETAACPGAVPGGADAGASGSGGASGRGGTSGSSGIGGGGGAQALAGGGARAIASGGAQAAGRGGAGGTFASVATGGVIAPSATGGIGAPGASAGVTADAAGMAGMDLSPAKQATRSGCSCRVAQRSTSAGAQQTAVLLAALGLLTRARRRARFCSAAGFACGPNR